MDASAKIETFQRLLRMKFRTGTATPDVVGLRKYITDLEAEASGSVVINSMSFEGEQATGQLVLEPMVRLTAALDVLAEVDPTASPARPDYAFMRIPAGCRPAC